MRPILTLKKKPSLASSFPDVGKSKEQTHNEFHMAEGKKRRREYQNVIHEELQKHKCFKEKLPLAKDIYRQVKDRYPEFPSRMITVYLYRRKQLKAYQRNEAETEERYGLD